MITTATLVKEIETLPEESAEIAFDFILFLKNREKPKQCDISLDDAYGIFRGIDTSFKRDEEDRI